MEIIQWWQSRWFIKPASVPVFNEWSNNYIVAFGSDIPSYQSCKLVLGNRLLSHQARKTTTGHEKVSFGRSTRREPPTIISCESVIRTEFSCSKLTLIKVILRGLYSRLDNSLLNCSCSLCLASKFLLN